MTQTLCPRCKTPLVESRYHEIEILACPTCRGALAESSCLSRLTADEADLEMVPLSTQTPLVHDPCGGHFNKYLLHGDFDLRVDICEQCRKVWFDSEEMEYTDTLDEIISSRAGIDTPFQWFHGLFAFLSSMPVEYNGRTRKLPVVTLLLILLNIGVFAGVVSGWLHERDLVFFSVESLGKPWIMTAFTSMFMHKNIGHLVGNMYFLFIFGDNVEDVMGRWRFLCFYLVGGVIGLAAQMTLHHVGLAAYMGASGAVSAVMGAYLIYFRRARIALPLPFLWLVKSWRKVPAYVWCLIFVVFNILGMFHGGKVAYWSHLGGFFFGALYALITYKKTLRNNMFLKFINEKTR